MINNAGFACQQGMRSFRLRYLKSGECQFNFDARKCFSNSSFCGSAKKDCSTFSYKSIVEQWNSLKSFRDVKSKCNEKFAELGEILTEQFNFYAAQRIRRMSQIWNLYTRLYTEKSIKRIVSQIAGSLCRQKTRPLAFLMGVGLFSWESEKITDNEISNSICELNDFASMKEDNCASSMQKRADCKFIEQLKSEGWEAVIQREGVHLWRKSFPNSYLFEYKIFGTFFDVPARAFFSVQTDIEYRKKWDKLVIKLDVIDQEDDSEVVHWVMNYPCPMYSREYVYVRRAVVDSETNTMVLVSRAVEHPECPVNNKYVRVSKYASKMVIKPHRTFDDNGFDYVMTYFDDPQAAFPSVAYNWMASSGVPDFVERLHAAARELHLMQQQQRRVKTSVPQSKASNQSCPSGNVEYAYM